MYAATLSALAKEGWYVCSFGFTAHEYKKKDIRYLIIQSLVEAGEEEISVLAFHAMWPKFFSRIQIWKTSSFSKCSMGWEFTSTMENVVNNKMKDTLKREHQHHHELQCQE